MNNFGQYAVVTSRTIYFFRNLDDVILFFSIFCKNVHNSKTICSSLKYKTYLKRRANRISEQPQNVHHFKNIDVNGGKP